MVFHVEAHEAGFRGPIARRSASGQRTKSSQQKAARTMMYRFQAYNSKNGPVTNAVHVKPSFSLHFKYSTVSSFPLKICGRIATAFSFRVSLPNSDGMKRFTPALIAASMIAFCCTVLAVAMVETTASWPLNAWSNSASG